jgi:hypothetical protein
MAKFRNGFVTNSSSSSFIVSFDKVPRTLKEVKKLLFTKDQVAYSGYYSTECFSINDVAERVYQEIETAKSRSEEDLKRDMDGYFDDAPDYCEYTRGLDYKSKEYKVAYERFIKDHAEYIDKKYNAFMEKNKDKVVLTLNFSDNNGPLESAIEHGDLFNRLPHIKVSHH